jgi:hypothetical protein
VTAHPSSGAVPVLPNGDHYPFLAQDHRFGVVGNCLDKTVCVLGPELLDAFAADPPSILNKPTWDYELRREMERQWVEQGWRRLTVTEKADIWERFDSQFEFYEQKAKRIHPAISEPTPSLTWAIASIPARHEEAVADLTPKLLAGLQAVTRPGGRRYALASLHWYEHHTFDPHRPESAGHDPWALAVYADDDDATFSAPAFRFGVFANPLGQTPCIFGRELLAAMGNGLPVDDDVRCEGNDTTQQVQPAGLADDWRPDRTVLRPQRFEADVARLRKYALPYNYLTDQVTEPECRTLMQRSG